MPSSLQYRLINGDELTYCREELYWRMRYGGLIYGVSNPYRWPGMPACEDELEKIRRFDRARLEEWVKVQSLKIAPAGATLWDGWTHEPGIEPLTGHGPKPWSPYRGPFLVAVADEQPPRPPPRPRGTDYQWLAKRLKTQSEELAAHDQRVRDWSKTRTARLRRETSALLDRIEGRMRSPRLGRRRQALARFALWASEDHDYIEAMFNLYSQGRTRLL
jgi:hypothetical protein